MPEYEPSPAEVKAFELNSILHEGISHHIARAEQANALIHEIGDNAWEINREGFGDLFEILQASLAEDVILSITKLFDSHDRSREKRSIPSTLAWLRENAGELQIRDRTPMEQAVVNSGVGAEVVHSMDDRELLLSWVSYITSTLPQPKAFWRRRDKKIAHSEAVETPEHLEPRFDQAEELLEFAKETASVIGETFGVFYFRAQDGSYMLSASAKEPAGQLHRVLQRAHLLDTTKDKRRRIEHRGIKIEAGEHDGVWLATSVDSSERFVGVGTTFEKAEEEVVREIDEFYGPEDGDPSTGV